MIVTLLMPSQVLLCSGLEKYSRSGAWEHWTLQLGLGTWSLAAISDTGVGQGALVYWRPDLGHKV